MAEDKSNKVKFGISNLHIAKITGEEGGKLTYDTPFKVPGAVSLTADPEGETTPFYADNIVYYIATSNQGYTGDLEIALAIEKILTDILGQKKDKNGALIEKSDDINSPFALMGEIEGDAQKRRFVYFNCTLARPSSEMNTKEESVEPQTDTLAITMSPRSTDNAIKAVIEPSETNSAIYEKFFEKVYEEDMAGDV